MQENRPWFQWRAGNRQCYGGCNIAAGGAESGGWRDFRLSDAKGHRGFLMKAELMGHTDVTQARPCGPDAAGHEESDMRTMTKTAKITVLTLPAVFQMTRLLAGAALALALLAIPHAGHAQGIVRGAQEGAYEGNRAAGPVGGVVGGAIGAGVGGRWARWTACSGFPIGALSLPRLLQSLRPFPLLSMIFIRR